MKRKGNTEVKVGLFVLVALLIGGTLAFVIGNQRNVFESKTTYTATFDDVGGLRPGSPVRVAGVSVGTVTEVGFSDRGQVRVSFRIVDDSKHLIRGNTSFTPEQLQRVQADPDEPQPSFATVGSKGMLGDQLIDVTVGDRSYREWDPNVPLPISNAGDLMGTVTRTLGKVSSAVTEIQGTAHNLRMATEPLATEQFTKDLQDTAHNLATLTGLLAEGEGAVPRLINDPSTGRHVDETVNAIRRASTELAQAAADVRAITTEVRSGDGGAHQLIYGDSSVRAVSSIGDAAGEVALLLRDVRTGDGTAHDLIYEDSADEMITNLTQASENVAHITGEIRAGRGTIGGLLMDPSIYEDVKRLVGDLQRNEILRALVRYSIRRDEARERTDVEGPE